MTLPPAVTVHGVRQARAALQPGLPVLLLSAPGAALYAGAGWWRGLVATVLEGAAPQPDALDCADAAGRALEALHLGCRIIVLAPCPARSVVLARAGAATVLERRPASLDLALRGNERRLRAWLRGDSAATIR